MYDVRRVRVLWLVNGNHKDARFLQSDAPLARLAKARSMRRRSRRMTPKCRSLRSWRIQILAGDGSEQEEKSELGGHSPKNAMVS